MSRRSMLQNAIRMHAVAAANLRTHPRTGTISGYDPNRHAVKIMLQPEGSETGWIPLGSVWVGNGWGMFAAPTIGTQVEVTFVDGNSEAGSANLRFFSNVERPLPAPGGEMWIVHKNGQFAKLTNDGKFTVSDGQGATVSLNGDGTITITGPTTFVSAAHFQDNVQVDKTLTANTDVVGGGKSLKTHVHGGVSSGGSNTGAPV